MFGLPTRPCTTTRPAMRRGVMAGRHCGGPFCLHPPSDHGPLLGRDHLGHVHQLPPCRRGRLPVCGQHLGRADQQPRHHRSGGHLGQPRGQHPRIGLAVHRPPQLHRRTRAGRLLPGGPRQSAGSQRPRRLGRHHLQLRKRRQLVLRPRRQRPARGLRFRDGGPPELCHGLGFIGSTVANTVRGPSGSPFIYDTFINDNGSAAASSTSTTPPADSGMPSRWRLVGRSQWTGGRCGPTGIYAPTWEPGASFPIARRHASRATPMRSTPNLNTGEAIHVRAHRGGHVRRYGLGSRRLRHFRMLAGAQSPCNPTNFSKVILIYDDAPAGLLNVNGSLFTVTGGPRSFEQPARQRRARGRYGVHRRPACGDAGLPVPGPGSLRWRTRT